MGNGNTSISRECGLRGREAGQAEGTVWHWLDVAEWWRIRAWAEPVGWAQCGPSTVQCVMCAHSLHALPSLAGIVPCVRDVSLLLCCV